MQILGWCPQPSCSCFRSCLELFFCPSCQQVSCECCADTFVSFYYCPQCLFEIPTGMAMANRYTCPRNCFQCTGCNVPVNSRKNDKCKLQWTCPSCKTDSVSPEETDQSELAFVGLQREFQKAYSSNTACNVGASCVNDSPDKSMKLPFKRKDLAVRVGYSCNKCKFILSSTKMNGTSFSFPDSHLVLKSIVGMFSFEDNLGNKWIEFENKTDDNIIIRMANDEIVMDSVASHQSFYEIENVLNGNEPKYYQLDNMLWCKIEADSFEVHFGSFKLPFQIVF